MNQDEIIRAAVASIGEPLSITRLHGGDINDVFKLNISSDSYCIKLNSAKRYPGMFEAEADGLKALSACNTLTVPLPISTGEIDGTSYLIMEYIESGLRSEGAERAMGRGLADLHQITSEAFGWSRSNYIGSLPQFNNSHKTWVEFFIQSRLIPQMDMAQNYLSESDRKTFDALFAELPDIFPNELPSLLHGDLWGGNWMPTTDEGACIYDPAVYYGHREMDIAMTRLFGGFGPTFYDVYNEVFPLAGGWRERSAICNLYPLLVHVNLFGAGYLSQIRDVLSKFT